MTPTFKQIQYPARYVDWLCKGLPCQHLEQPAWIWNILAPSEQSGRTSNDNGWGKFTDLECWILIFDDDKVVDVWADTKGFFWVVIAIRFVHLFIPFCFAFLLCTCKCCNRRICVDCGQYLCRTGTAETSQGRSRDTAFSVKISGVRHVPSILKYPRNTATDLVSLNALGGRRVARGPLAPRQSNWTLTDNMVVGVSKGFEKKLQLVGVGYRAMLENRDLVLNLGFSHPVRMPIPDGLQVKVEENTRITVSGYDKCSIGEFAASVRKWRPPEPYKGKGVKYADEIVRRKEGKAGKKK
ncbi:hypothetical protein IFM89_037495 [Coptis chinensis]|uniref:Large ribosomal subunit protein uL6 alpha-beta domain-containing protein n=1 Tax=Coptis chinensis TaxID=261450 RepID=A0A835M0N9_9MAGN|nr:hypothetical protein IFM89_037495 [Coptis chinensis]